MKQCCMCKMLLDESCFSKSKDRKDGLQPRCKKCASKVYAAQKEKISKARKEKYRELHPIIQVKDGYKICAKCQLEKPFSEFGKGSNKNGLRSRCKECRKEDYRDNASEINMKKKEHYQTNKEVILQRCKEYRETHKESISKFLADYYRRNSEQIKERSKKSYENITEAQIERRNQYYHRIRADVNFRAKRNEYAKRRRNTSGGLVSDLTEKQWNETLSIFGNACAYCGNGEVKLSRDHIVPITKGGGYTKNNIVPCCISCNSKKHNSNMEEWYREQPFFDEKKLLLIYKIMEA